MVQPNAPTSDCVLRAAAAAVDDGEVKVSHSSPRRRMLGSTDWLEDFTSCANWDWMVSSVTKCSFVALLSAETGNVSEMAAMIAEDRMIRMIAVVAVRC